MNLNRRHFLRQLCRLGVAASAFNVVAPTVAFARNSRSGLITKQIPASGEVLPVIGMGTSRTFDVEASSEVLLQLQEVLEIYFDNGGELIDSSPMYGNAEAVVGQLLSKIKPKGKLFAATKVWTTGKQDGIEQMQASMQKMHVNRFDLMQIHNLLDWQVHLKTLNNWKAEGKIRYTGITTSHGRDHQALAELLKKHPVDFVQLSYNIEDRVVEEHLLPIAQDRGIAVLVNRPFQRGALFRKTRGKPLPDWAADIDCESWAQFFLKFAVSHPAVNCVIPATSKPHHMDDNMGANFGRLPDMRMRSEMEQYFRRL